eukprot:INCI9900.1.p1 GENE.INCI9900.1~~INCI9900.1.p1  ORF type:complete len:588 (+),score=109.72 INCI9900.1:178-1941(+)
MGDVMSSLFPDAALLPGGPELVAVCESLQNQSLSNRSEFNTSDYDALNCDTSAVYGFIQLMMLFVFYGYVLFVASNLISDGSEMLTLIPSVKHIVGSIVLPVLGAVPDGAIVLFSGMGPIAGVQESIKVGVGALAGSTIMLLTIPWFMSILAGKVPIRNGKPVYSKKRRATILRNKSKGSKTSGCICCAEGVEAEPIVKANGIIMVCTLLAYFLVQIPALTLAAHGRAALETNATVMRVEAEDIKYWALSAFVVAVIMFIAYLIYSAKNTGSDADNDDARDNLASRLDIIGAKYVKESAVDIVSLFHQEFVMVKNSIRNKAKKRRTSLQAPLSGHETVPPQILNLRKRVERFVKKFFDHHDTDRSGYIDIGEYALLARTLGIPKNSNFMSFEVMDADNSGTISYNEFLQTLLNYVENYDKYRGQVRNVVSTRFSAAAMFVKGRAMTYSIREENEEDNGNDAGLNNTDGDELGESAPALSPRYATAINASEGLAGLEVPEPNESFPDAPYAGQIDTVIDDAHDYHADSDDEDGNGDGDGDEDSEEEEHPKELYDVDERTGRRVLNLTRVKLQSFKLMAMGTILVLLFF